jgi:signal recognition particle receptor subunit beta
MSTAQAPSSSAKHAAETLDLAVQGARAYEREDLAERLTATRTLLSDSSVTVHVVGEFKQGKSSLINALLGIAVCPVDDDIATCVATEVRYADRESAVATFESTSGSGGAGWTEPIAPAELAGYVSESGNAGNHRRLRSVAVGLNRPLLQRGLVLVDTPGVGGIGSTTNAAALSALPRSHAVLFVTDVSQELTDAELGFLRAVQDLCPHVVVVLTKTDLYPHWQRIRDLDAAHLERAGIPLELVPLSNTVRWQAAKADDRELNEESGFPVLVGRVNEVIANAGRLALDTVTSHVSSVIDQLEVVMRAKRTALDDPDAAGDLVVALTAAKDRADALRDRSARWQQLLSDGFSDIASDVDFDLRDRSRAVLHEAESTIDAGDPAKGWEDFETWLRQRLAGEALENYATFVRRAKEVARTVGEHFELAEADVIGVRRVDAPVDMIGGFAMSSEFVERKAKGAGMAAFQKAYGGFLMFTMLAHMTALVIPTPFGLVAAALMGGSGIKEERRRQLDRRRSEAKTAVRRFVDEFNLQVGKDSRDAVRHVQRELRTAWSERVAELQRSANEALAAAQQAVRGDEDAVGARERLDQDLALLTTLRARLDDLATHRERVEAPPEPAPAVPAASSQAGAGR